MIIISLLLDLLDYYLYIYYRQNLGIHHFKLRISKFYHWGPLAEHKISIRSEYLFFLPSLFIFIRINSPYRPTSTYEECYNYRLTDFCVLARGVSAPASSTVENITKTLGPCYIVTSARLKKKNDRTELGQAIYQNSLR